MEITLNVARVKIVVTIPIGYLELVRNAIFEAGAGKVGNYTCCSIATKCTGTFKPGNLAKPYIGEKDKLEIVQEEKLEFVCDIELLRPVLDAIKTVHPYETPAIDIFPLLDPVEL